MKEKIKKITQKDKDGKSISYRVEEIENGFLVTQDYEDKDKKGNWTYITKKMYHKENPFDDKIMDKFDIMKKSLNIKE